MRGITSRVLIAHVLVAIPILKWLRLLGPDYANHSCFIAAMSR